MYVSYWSSLNPLDRGPVVRSPSLVPCLAPEKTNIVETGPQWHMLS